MFTLSLSKCRAAGNRTQSTRTRIVCTTGILRPAVSSEALAKEDYVYFTKDFL